MRPHVLLAWIILTGIFLVPLLRYGYRNYLVWRWKKRLHLDKHQKQFDDLYQGVNGFRLSKEARISGDALEYLYGEIDFLSFIAMINLTHPHRDTVFYDLGSGTGKAVIACALLYDMKQYNGIELFEPLHEAAELQKKKFAKLKSYKKRARHIHFINGNFLHTSFYDATLVFINATAFLGETWEQLNENLDQTAVGTQVITISKKLISNQFVEKRVTLIQMSWGVATAYLYEHR
ncbi:MAG: hypothetical protein NTW08_02300 [Gammaproteobacteria bacterium]|nr:hypothetical protein [Gammaproteobacteria bacterium]